jgi:hypothetical protein
MIHRVLPLVLLLTACDSVQTEPDPSELETLPDANPGTDPPPVGDAGVTSSTPEAPLVASLHVQEVRSRRAAHQGATAVPLHVLGERLGNATVTIDGVVLPVTSATDNELIVTWDVPHAAPLGGRTVVVASAAGSTTVTDGVEVTAIHIDQGVIGGDGTPDAPYGALHTTLAKTKAGDEVRLIGNFEIGKAVPVPAGVHVVGEGEATWLAAADGYTGTGMTLGDGASLYGVGLKGFSVCLSVSGGNASIAKVSVDQCGMGMVFGDRAAVDLSGIDLENCAEYAIHIIDARSVTIREMALLRTGKAGIRLQGGALSIEKSTLTQGLVTAGGSFPLYWDARPTQIPAGRALSFDAVSMKVPDGTYKGPYKSAQILIDNQGNSVTVSDGDMPK